MPDETPHGPTKTELWAPFEELIDDADAVPELGWRIVAFVEADGTAWVRWDTVGEPSTDQTVAVMERIKFRSLHQQAHMGDGEPDRSDEDA